MASNKPSVGMVRRKVREVCAMAAGHGKTEKVLLPFTNELTGGGVDLQQLRDALEWLLGEAQVRYQENAETEEREWFITKAGVAAEAIK